MAQARKAERRGMFTGRREAGEAGEEEVFKVLDDVASATVITSFIGAFFRRVNDPNVEPTPGDEIY